jgi:hypothetical protein
MLNDKTPEANAINLGVCHFPVMATNRANFGFDRRGFSIGISQKNRLFIASLHVLHTTLKKS